MQVFRTNPGQIEDEKAVTKSDSDISNAMFKNGRVPANALYIGGAGNVKVRFVGDPFDTVNGDAIISLAVGIWRSTKPFSHVYSTGTTATDIRVGVTYGR